MALLSREPSNGRWSSSLTCTVLAPSRGDTENVVMVGPRLEGNSDIEGSKERLEPACQQCGADASKFATHRIVDLPLRTDQSAAASAKKLRPWQWLGPRIVIEQLDVAQCARRVTGHQHRLDRIAIEPQMIVTDSAA